MSLSKFFYLFVQIVFQIKGQYELEKKHCFAVKQIAHIKKKKMEVAKKSLCVSLHIRRACVR